MFPNNIFSSPMKKERSKSPELISNQNSLTYQEEEQMYQIRKKLFFEINALRTQLCLNQLNEDHTISKFLRNFQNTPILGKADILAIIGHKVSDEDIDLMQIQRNIRNLSLNPNYPRITVIERLLYDMLEEAIGMSYKEKMLSGKFNNMVISPKFQYPNLTLSLFLTSTILSVDEIFVDSDDIYEIQGTINNDDYQLFVILIKSSRYEYVISPNRMSYDFCSRMFSVRFDRKCLNGMLDDNPELEFYVKKDGGNTSSNNGNSGNNSTNIYDVKYGQGDDLSHNDVVRMSALLTLAYSMPLIICDSMHVKVAQAGNPGYTSKFYAKASHQVNSTLPEFNLANKVLQQKAEEMRRESMRQEGLSQFLPPQSPNRRFTIFSKYQNDSGAIYEEEEKGATTNNPSQMLLDNAQIFQDETINSTNKSIQNNDKENGNLSRHRQRSRSRSNNQNQRKKGLSLRRTPDRTEEERAAQQSVNLQNRLLFGQGNGSTSNNNNNNNQFNQSIQMGINRRAGSPNFINTQSRLAESQRTRPPININGMTNTGYNLNFKGDDIMKDGNLPESQKPSLYPGFDEQRWGAPITSQSQQINPKQLYSTSGVPNYQDYFSQLDNKKDRNNSQQQQDQQKQGAQNVSNGEINAEKPPVSIYGSTPVREYNQMMDQQQQQQQQYYQYQNDYFSAFQFENQYSSSYPFNQTPTSLDYLNENANNFFFSSPANYNLTTPSPKPTPHDKSYQKQSSQQQQQQQYFTGLRDIGVQSERKFSRTPDAANTLAHPRRMGDSSAKAEQFHHQILLNRDLGLYNQNPNIITTSNGQYRAIKSMAKVNSYSHIEDNIDPKIFDKDDELSQEAKHQLNVLEQRMPGNKLDTVNQYIKLYESKDNYDVVLRFRYDEIRAHRVVLLQSSYFEKLFKNTKFVPNQTAKFNMPDYMRIEPFKKALKYLYYSEIQEKDLKNLSIIEARELFLTAYILKLHYVMKRLLTQCIIPKMEKSLCFEFLKDSCKRDEAKLIWKTLQNYCISYFAYNSRSILQGSGSKLLDGLEAKVIYKLISKALLQCKDIDHMYQLLSLLVEQGFGANIIDILDKVPLVNDTETKKFDVKHLPAVDDILLFLDPAKSYVADFISSDQCFMHKSFTGKILEDDDDREKKETKINVLDDIMGDGEQKLGEIQMSKSKVIEGTTSSKAKENANHKNISPIEPPKYNHLDLNMRYNKRQNQIPGHQEWQDIKRKDPNHEFKVDIDQHLKNKTIISQAFDSQNRSWNLILDIEDDQKVSVFVMERGEPSHKKLKSPFNYEFTSIRFLIQIRDNETDYETVVFHSFANNHNYCIGHRRFFNLAYLSNKTNLHVRIWMMEFPIYSCCLQYLSTRFSDLMKEVFQDSQQSSTISIKNDERMYLGTQKNIFNQPKTRHLKPEEKKQRETNKRRSIKNLEKNFFDIIKNPYKDHPKENARVNNNDQNMQVPSQNHHLEVPQTDAELQQSAKKDVVNPLLSASKNPLLENNNTNNTAGKATNPAQASKNMHQSPYSSKVQFPTTMNTSAKGKGPLIIDNMPRAKNILPSNMQSANKNSSNLLPQPSPKIIINPCIEDEDVGRTRQCQSKSKKQSKNKSFRNISAYDFYYLISSDFLTIEHEKFLAYFMYHYGLDKSDDDLTLVIYGLRFSYVELSKLFNMARDLLPLRSNKVFISKLDLEISKRINCNEPFDRPRRFYSNEMYKKWSFKQDFINWLIESDHHQGYRLKVDELKKIIVQKDKEISKQNMLIKDMGAELQKANMKIMKQNQESMVSRNEKKYDQVQQQRLIYQPPEIKQNQYGVVQMVQEQCNIF